MKMRTLVSIFACVCGLSLSTPVLADEADELFAAGGKAFNAQKYDDALRSFEAAWKLRQSYDIAGGLAQTELQMGKHREAAAHLAFALRTFPATGDAELRKLLQATYAETRKHVTSVRVTVNVDGADVRVDGVSVGRAPLADEVFVDAGPHVVEARLSQHVTASRKLEAKKGTEERVELVLTAEGPTAQPNRLPAYIAFGAGGLGLIVGAVTGGISIAKYGEVTSMCSPDRQCPEALRGEVDTGKALGHVATVGFVLAGVGAAAGTTLLLISPGKTPSRAALTVGPTFVGVKGAF